MKLFKPLALTVLGLSALTVSAQKTVNEFPGLLIPGGDKEAAEVMTPNRAPLNTIKALGTPMFGAMYFDRDRPRHFFKGYSNNLGRIEKIGTIYEQGNPDEEYYPDLYMIWSGAYADDGYYAFKVNFYTFGPTIYTNSWIKVNPETGEYDVLANLFKQEIYTNWEYIYDLAYSHGTKKMYGLAQNEDGTVTSMIGEIDLEDGTFTKKVVSLPEYYFAFAFDYDGRCYAIRWEHDEEGVITGTILDRFDSKWNVEFSREVKVDDKEFLSYYQHSLAFDYETGDLWWFAANTSADQYVVKINPDDATTTNYGRLGVSEIGIGLHIPYQITADARTAPARVSGLGYTLSDNQNVVLKWTNPTTQWNRRKLSDMAEVAIYRDKFEGEPVGKVDATGKVGQEMTWTDETAARGVHTYYVVPCAKAGEKGVMDSISAFAGRDVPGPVQNLSAVTPNGKSVAVTWEKPVIGDSDGWFDDSDLSYKVTRMPDNKVVGTTKELRYNDIDIPEAQSYYYVVQAINADGEGTSVESNRVIAGQSIILPFYTNFAEKVDADRFTVLDINRDGKSFEYDINLVDRSPSMHFSMVGTGDEDAIVTPPFLLKKDKTYRVTFKFQIDGYGTDSRIFMMDFKTLGGTEPAMEFLTDELGDYPDFTIKGRETITDLVTYFKSPVDGDYYTAFYLKCTDEREFVWIDLISVEMVEVADNDLEVTKLETYKNVSNQYPNNFYVTVYNNGNNPMSDYKAQVAAIDVNGNPVVCGEAEGPALEPHKSARIEVVGSPDRYGVVDLVGKVDCAKDEDASNDLSKPVEVNVDAYTALTNTFTQGQESESSRVPMSFYHPYSVTQTYYTPEVTNLKSLGDKVTISRIAFEYDADKDINTTDLRVYLTQSDKTTVTNTTEWTKPSGMPIFDGKASFKKGKGNYLVIDIDEDNLVTFDPKKSLMLTVMKEDRYESEYSVRFRNFNDIWAIEDRYYTLLCQDNSPFDYFNPGNVKNWPNAAVLHISAQDPEGVKEITIAEAATLTYNVTTGELTSTEDMLSVDVYDLAGMHVKSIKPSGRVAVVTCATGAYIFKVKTAKGEASVKTIVKK